MSKSEKIKRSILIIIIMLIAFASIMDSRNKRAKEKEQVIKIVEEYNTDIIRTTFKEKNYLISPYNIKIALNMLMEGADGNTKDQIEKVIGKEEIKDINVKNKLSVANAIFIKNDFKSSVKKDFTNTMKDKYHSEIIYDEFKTPKVVNDWVKEKTNGMIDKVLDKMKENSVMGIASALALDIKWFSPFNCPDTKEEEFTKIDNSKMKTEMMHQTYEDNAKYIKDDDVDGIIVPYNTDDSNVELEFIGLLPKNKVTDYVRNIDINKINNLIKSAKEANENLHINLSLPRFSYGYEVDDFIHSLKKMGISDVFSPTLADLSKISDTKGMLYVGDAIHKTKIDLNENGTVATATTYFDVMYKGMSLFEERFEKIDIKFNKPFAYMIREKNTGEILFFGTVYEPNKWTKETCS